MFRFIRCAFTCASLLLIAPHVLTAQYRFVNIADSRGPFESFDFLAQAVSDNGQVAFIGSQGGVAGTYVGDGTSTTNIVPDLSPPLGFNGGGAQALNTSGVAVGDISCCAPLETKVLLYEATGTRTIAEATAETTFTRWLSADDINNNGAVAFRRYQTSSGLAEFSITRWFDGTSTTVLETLEGFTSVDSIQLNEPGDVAFRGSSQVAEYTYYRTDGTTLTLIADSSGPLNIPFAPPTGLAINDSGMVAFWSRLDAGGEGIFVGDGGPLTTVAIADPTTPFNDLMWTDSIDINNRGTVAFFAELWDGRRGIFTGDDPANDKVIAHGDLLFGQRVNGIGRPHLNERGDIAFWFSVQDPRVPEGEWSGIALALAPQPTVATWNIDANGSWSAAGNWTGGVPNAAGARAVFGGVIIAPRTVTVDVPISVGRIDFENANAYTIAGANGITLDVTSGSAEINVASGNHMISAPVTLADDTLITVSPAASNLSITGALSASGRNFTKAGAGTVTLNHVRAAGLSINDGTVAVVPNGTSAGTSVLGSLSIAGASNGWTAKLDDANNDSIVHSTAANKPADFGRLYNQVKQGFNGGNWQGLGITSATAAANPAADTGLSIVDNVLLGYHDFSGQPVTADSILLKYTYYGDIDQNGQVDADDLTVFANNFGRASGATQIDGDIDFNGTVDADDLTVFANNFNKGVGNPLGASRIQALPEPGTLLLATLATALAAILARRRMIVGRSPEGTPIV